MINAITASFRKRILWSTVSKASFKSMKITPFIRPLSAQHESLLAGTQAKLSMFFFFQLGPTESAHD